MSCERCVRFSSQLQGPFKEAKYLWRCVGCNGRGLTCATCSDFSLISRKLKVQNLYKYDFILTFQLSTCMQCMRFIHLSEFVDAVLVYLNAKPFCFLTLWWSAHIQPHLECVKVIGFDSWGESEEGGGNRCDATWGWECQYVVVNMEDKGVLWKMLCISHFLSVSPSLSLACQFFWSFVQTENLHGDRDRSPDPFPFLAPLMELHSCQEYLADGKVAALQKKWRWKYQSKANAINNNNPVGMGTFFLWNVHSFQRVPWFSAVPDWLRIAQSYGMLGRG